MSRLRFVLSLRFRVGPCRACTARPGVTTTKAEARRGPITTDIHLRTGMDLRHRDMLLIITITCIPTPRLLPSSPQRPTIQLHAQIRRVNVSQLKAEKEKEVDRLNTELEETSNASADTEMEAEAQAS